MSQYRLLCFIWIAFFLAPDYGFSQKKTGMRTQSGFEAGYSHHFIGGNQAPQTGLQTLPGYHVYLFQQWKITSHVGFQVAGGWTQRIYRYNDDVYFNSDRQQEVKINRFLHHLTVPVTLALQSKNFCWHLGAYKEWPLASESDPNAPTSRPNLPGDGDYGMILSGEWQFGPIGFFARYLHGLSSHSFTPYPDETGASIISDQPQIRTLQAGIRCAVF